MLARKYWTELNSKKYSCPTCGFNTFNKTHFTRHVQSNKYFLITEFAEDCPRDLKILVASFLPVYIIFNLPERISAPALKLAWRQSLTRDPVHVSCKPLWLPFADPRAQNVV